MCVPAGHPAQRRLDERDQLARPPRAASSTRARPPAAQTGNFTANNTAGQCARCGRSPTRRRRPPPPAGPSAWAPPSPPPAPDGSLAIDSAFFNNKGGSGACPGFDGFDHIGSVILGGGSLTNDYERFEAQNPYLVLAHELWTDSGGAGTWRGGLGTRSHRPDRCRRLHAGAARRPGLAPRTASMAAVRRPPIATSSSCRAGSG